LFFTRPAPPVFCTLSLHDALPIWEKFRALGGFDGFNARFFVDRPLDRLEMTARGRVVRVERDGAFERRPRERQAARLERDPAERSEEHTSELQSRSDLVCRLLLEK